MFKFFRRKSKNTALNLDKMKAVDTELTNRQMLIKSALEIRKNQSKLLDNLDEVTKNRLKNFAEERIFKIKRRY